MPTKHRINDGNLKYSKDNTELEKYFLQRARLVLQRHHPKTFTTARRHFFNDEYPNNLEAITRQQTLDAIQKTTN